MQQVEPKRYTGVADARLRGAQNRASGAAFEQIINAGCDFYRKKGIADIRKVPEPMKIIKSLGNGRFVAHFAAKAEPDYKGYFMEDGAGCIMFEAKETDAESILQSAVNPSQTEELERADAAGVIVFVLVSFGNRDFYRVEWSVWKDMKKIFGHKKMSKAEADLRCLQSNGGVKKIRYDGRVLRFMEP